MKVVIAGGSGFLGTALATALVAERHEVIVLTRAARDAHGAAPVSGVKDVRHVPWNPDGTAGDWTPALVGAAALINLAGESIAGGRWSAARKELIERSRVLATRSLVTGIASLESPPALFLSGSAVGYYGPRGDEIISEDTAAGGDFLARVCVAWEAEAARAGSHRVRTVTLRTGLVLARAGGALPRMLLPFYLGIGGPLASGRQFWPWIHIDDWVGLVRWLISTPAVSGPVNATAPNPVTNAEFSRCLGRAMRRPALLPTPGFALRMLLGEMADGLLLSGQRAVPAKALAADAPFRFSRLEEALSDLFR